MPDANEFSPFFVVGCPRSGTTLLTVLLDRHTDLVVPPETHFFHCVYEDSPSQHHVSHAQMMERFFKRSMIQTIPLDQAALLAEFREGPADYPSFFRCMVQFYARNMAHKPNARIGEKTATHLDYVPLILSYYPNAKVIWIIRDGRDNVRALMRHPGFHRNLRRHCFTWCRQVNVGRAWEKRFPNSIFRVHLEDLLRQPETTLAAVDNFLGVPFQKEQLDSTQNSGAVLPKEMQHKGRALQPLDPSRVEEWKREGSPEEIRIMHAIMKNHLLQAGYAVDMPVQKKGSDFWANLPIAWTGNRHLHAWAFSLNLHLSRLLGRSARRPAKRLRQSNPQP